MEYSRFAASEPKAKFGSKETLKRGSFAGKGSAEKKDMRVVVMEGGDREVTCGYGWGSIGAGVREGGLELVCVARDQERNE